MALRQIRESKGLTLQQVAEKVGLSYQAVALYEQGLRKPKIDTIKKLAEVLDVDVKEILECF